MEKMVVDLEEPYLTGFKEAIKANPKNYRRIKDPRTLRLWHALCDDPQTVSDIEMILWNK